MRLSNAVGFSILLVASAVFAQQPSPSKTPVSPSSSGSGGTPSSTKATHSSQSASHAPVPHVVSPCGRGEIWKGTACILKDSYCDIDPFEADDWYWALQGARARMKTTCAKNPTGQECEELAQRYRDLLLSYKMLLCNCPNGEKRAHSRDHSGVCAAGSLEDLN